MSTLISLDPGIRGIGIALWINGILKHCAYVKNLTKFGNGPSECVDMANATIQWIKSIISIKDVMNFFVEWPRVYQRMENKTKGDPNMLRCLWGVDCAIAALLPEAQITFTEPAGWKGQMIHEAVESRVRTRLSPEEKIVYKVALEEAKSLGHNVTDAVGIGLYFLKRFDRVRVIHRKGEELSD